MEDRRGVAFTIAVVIQTRNVTSKSVPVNVRTLLLLMGKHMKRLLQIAQPANCKPCCCNDKFKNKSIESEAGY